MAQFLQCMRDNNPIFNHEPFIMIRNYFVTTLRNIKRNAGSTTINVAGLVLGLTGAITVYLITSYLLNYDSYHKKANRIFRIVTESKVSTGTEFTAGVPVPFAEAFQSEFPEVENLAFVSYQRQGLVEISTGEGRKTFEEDKGVAFVTPELYSILDRSWIAGNAKSWLAPNTVALSEKYARKYFNSTDVLGKTIRLDNKYDLQISGIMEDYPDNTHFPFDIMISYETVRSEMEGNGGWGSTNSNDQCYILLRDAADASAINGKLATFSQKQNKLDPTGRERLFFLQPLNDLHFDPRFGNYLQVSVGWVSIITMIVIGVFLLISAIVNFINLSTAMAIRRAKEVAIRKVIGGNRLQLIFQLVGETFIITVVALLISMGLLELIIMLYINPYLNIQLLTNLTSDVRLVTFLLSLLFTVTLLAGLYPAIILSGFKPVDGIRSSISTRSSGGFSFRKSLVVFQFVISQIFIIGTITIYWQMDFLKQFDMGFRKDAIYTLTLPDAGKAFAFQNNISNLRGVEATSLSVTPPSSNSSSATYLKRINDGNHYTFQYKSVDTAFLKLYNIQLIAGKNLHVEDTFRNILVNETLAHHLGFENVHDALGESFEYDGRVVHIQGVVQDFHATSLKKPVMPLFLRYEKESFYTISIAVGTGNWSETLASIENEWKALYPDHIYAGSFLDDQIASFYQGEQKLGLLITVFSGVAIFIGCLGLYGLVLFMAGVRTKEVSIRKVMGASVVTIVGIFSWEFIKLVLIAFFIAAPIAWFGLEKFLQNYTHQIDLGWQVFLSGILVTFIIAFITIGFHTIKSAMANPIDALRSE